MKPFYLIKDGEVVSEHSSMSEALDATEDMVRKGNFKYAAIMQSQGHSQVMHLMLEKWNATQTANLNSEILYTPGEDLRAFLTDHMDS